MEDKQRRSPICDLPLKLNSKQCIEINAKAFDGFILDKQARARSYFERSAKLLTCVRSQLYAIVSLRRQRGVVAILHVKRNRQPCKRMQKVEVIEVERLGKKRRRRNYQ